jgi:orotate phosphoribosyltransferase
VVEDLVGEGIAQLQAIERLNDMQVVVAGSLYLVRNYLKYVS